jgi:hypothetical protein
VSATEYGVRSTYIISGWRMGVFTHHIRITPHE